MKFILSYRTELSIFLPVPIHALRWYRFVRYSGTDSCAMMVPFRRYYHSRIDRKIYYKKEDILSYVRNNLKTYTNNGNGTAGIE